VTRVDVVQRSVVTGETEELWLIEGQRLADHCRQLRVVDFDAVFDVALADEVETE